MFLTFVDGVLPALLVLAWLALWTSLRRVPWWYWVGGFGLVLLCVPGGHVAGEIELDGFKCTPENLCFSMSALHVWLNGGLGLLALTGLGAVTLLATLTAPRGESEDGG